MLVVNILRDLCIEENSADLFIQKAFTLEDFKLVLSEVQGEFQK